MKLKLKQQLPCLFNGNLPDDLQRSYTNALIILQGRAWVHYSLVINTKVVWSCGLATAGTDGGFIYLNPVFFMGLANDSQRAFLLAHEAAHIMFRHQLRGDFYEDRGYHSRQNGDEIPWDHREFNRAADYVINDDLKAFGLEAIPEGLYDSRFTRDHLADHVYLTLMAEKPKGKGGGQPGNEPPEDGEDEGDDTGKAKSEDDGDEPTEGEGEGEGDTEGESKGDTEGEGKGKGKGKSSTEGGSADDKSDGTAEGSDGPIATPHDGHDSHFKPKYEGSTPEEEERAKEQVKEEVERIIDDAIDALDDMVKQGEKHIGLSSALRGQSYRHSGQGAASSTNWRHELADAVVRNGKGGESNPSRINRRKFATAGLIYPTTLGTINRIALGVDISGSVYRDALHQTMLELASLIDLMQPTSGCLVMWVNDCVVGYHEVFSGAELLELDVPNYGGTTMSSMIGWMESMGFDADVTICFTDGYMYDWDWQKCAEHGLLMVLDRHPDAYIKQMIDKAGARVIVASDERLAA